MEPRPRQVLIYTDARGRRPFEGWFASLKDAKARGLIRARIARLEGGNFGDCEPVGDGVMELRIHHGPGYQLCFGKTGDTLILLLCGGSKRTQQRDIEKAKRYWKDAQETL